jgi:exportin-1
MFLQRLIHFTMNGTAKAPIFDPSAVPNPNISNAEYLSDYINGLLANAFPHLQPGQIKQSVGESPSHEGAARLEADRGLV